MELSFGKGPSISKWCFDFTIEHQFRNGAAISKWCFDFEMEVRFRNGASISKWRFDFEIKLSSRIGASILKCNFQFEIWLRSGNGVSISKSKNRTSVLKSKTLLICVHVTTWKNASRIIQESLTKRTGQLGTACDTWQRGIYQLSATCAVREGNGPKQ